MKHTIRRQAGILFLSWLVSSSAWAAEENSGPADNESHTRTYTTQSETQLSRKCGIYSGICKMHERVEVGAYCVCQTPSGPIYGVVVP
jgi:hypothetical protein